MAKPTTRSLLGSTYVPHRRNNALSDIGLVHAVAETRTTETATARPLAKARLVARLCSNSKVAEAVTAAYRATYLGNSGGLSGDECSIQAGVLDIIEDYSNTRSYRALIEAIRGVPHQPLLQVVSNWIKIEQDALATALDDWRAAAKESAREDAGSVPPGVSSDAVGEIDKVNAEIISQLDHLKSEIASLKKHYGLSATNLPGEKSTDPRFRGYAGLPGLKVWDADVSTIDQPAASPTPKAKAWNKLWQDTDRRGSAEFLAAYLAPGRKTGDSLCSFMGAAISSNSISEINDMMLLEGMKSVGNIRYKDIGAAVKEIEIEPVGVLFLERLDFTPIAYVRGELVYTLPLTPGETAAVSHKEWSFTSEEYVKEVVEELETQLDKEVSESTELTESSKSESEVTHKASAELKIGMESGSWTFEASGGYDYENCRSNAIENAMKRDREITHKASSRSKTQHKLTFTVKREQRIEDEHVREIKNEGTEPVRWDFYRLMKKWQIDLYHIGERLTYEVMVPEPGHYLLRKYIELKAIQDEIDAGDPFDMGADNLTRDNWEQLAGLWGAEIDPPPAVFIEDLYFEDSVEYPGHKETGTRTLEIEVPEGYAIIRIERRTDMFGMACETNRRGEDGRHLPDIEVRWDDLHEVNFVDIPDNARRFNWLWYYSIDEGATCAVPKVQFRVRAALTFDGFRKWRMESWSKLREAARVKWITTLEALQNKRDRLTAELFGKDSLKLRQIEQEEVMKGVLCWLIGPEFEFYPELLQVLHEHMRNRMADEADAAGLLPPALDPLAYYDEETQRLDGQWYQDMVAEYGDMIRFIHHAIEWENVKWVLYPYFWTFPGRWDFKQSLEHPDFYHRSFLRAGAARVIIPIRPGFEEAWLSFAEGEMSQDHPYITLAEELKADAETNYMYTPDPNRETLQEEGVHIDRWLEYTPTGALHIEAGEAPEDA